MKHQRIQNHLSRSAHLQMSQIKNKFTNFSYNHNIPQKYKIFSDAQKFSGQSQNEKKCAQLKNRFEEIGSRGGNHDLKCV